VGTTGHREGHSSGRGAAVETAADPPVRAVPEWVETKLAGAEPAQLEVWGERVLNAPLLEAVFGE